MERYRELKEMLHAELDRIQNRGELSAASLAQADTIAHTLKDIATVEAMENAEGYSEHYPPYRNYYDDGGAYGRGRGARRDSMGRYSEARRERYDDGRSYEEDRNR